MLSSVFVYVCVIDIKCVQSNQSRLCIRSDGDMGRGRCEILNCYFFVEGERGGGTV